MSGNGQSVDAFTAEAINGTYPLLPEERKWGLKAIITIMLTSGLASWSYVIGGYVSYYLNAFMGSIAMCAGSLVGMMLVIFAGVPSSVRYGIDIITASKLSFGTRGYGIPLVAQFFSIVGWNTVLMVLLGQAIGSGLYMAGVIDAEAKDGVARIASVVGVFLIWLLLKNGATGIQNASKYLSVLIVILAFAVFFFVVKQYGLEGIRTAEPSYADPDLKINYVLGFEILVGSVASWWAYIGGLTRMTGNPKHAMWPAAFCLGLATGLVSLIGLYTALVTGSPYPTDYLLTLAEGDVGFTTATTIFAIVALLFLILASIGITVVGTYSGALGLKQLGAIKNMGWMKTCLIVLGPTAVISGGFPSWFSDNSGVFFALLGMSMGPLCGVMIADYLILRKQNINLKALYSESRGSDYYFFGGVNPASIIGFLAGIATYLSMLNPITYEYHLLFEYLSATLPATIVAGAVYILVTKLAVAPRGLGGF
ncbi:MAG: cytosine permease [Clostridiales Family XIII bacterium]|jgi:NCS1 family nucleobase:cation symporter-1|nr:cytosine permease [Clostridiales Family XIII bacterium]